MGWVNWMMVGVFPVLPLSPTFAQLESERLLSGLAEVRVTVEHFHPDVERKGVLRAKLLSDIEHRLQQAGIHVLTEDEWQETPGKPLLYVSIDVEPLDSFPVYSVLIRLQLRQHSCLTRNLIICGTTITWEDVGAMQVMSVARLSSLPDDVGLRVDRFINAYQTDNANQ
jgi:hypothetical protein